MVVVSHDVLTLEVKTKHTVGVIMYRHAVVSTFIFAKAVAKNTHVYFKGLDGVLSAVVLQVLLHAVQYLKEGHSLSE